jgi:hypothetical protein
MSDPSRNQPRPEGSGPRASGDRRLGLPTLTISWLMALVVIAAILMTMARFRASPWAVIVVVLPLTFLMAPIQIHATLRVSAEFDFIPFVAGSPEIPEVVSDRIALALADLDRLGFSLRGHFRRANPGRLAVGYLSLFDSPGTRETAQVVSVATRVKTITSLTFTSRFDDGVEIVTSDGASLPIWPQPPRMRKLALPQIGDAARLLRVHRARVARHGGSEVGRLPGPEGDPAEHLRHSALEEWSRPIKAGYYTLDESRRLYCPTWKGACLMTWKLVWPITAIRRMASRRRAAIELRQLGMY